MQSLKSGHPGHITKTKAIGLSTTWLSRYLKPREILQGGTRTAISAYEETTNGTLAEQLVETRRIPAVRCHDIHLHITLEKTDSSTLVEQLFETNRSLAVRCQALCLHVTRKTGTSAGTIAKYIWTPMNAPWWIIELVGDTL